MDRDINPIERDAPERDQAGQAPELRQPERPTPDRKRELAFAHGSTYQISDAERQTLRDIGRFRTVAVENILHARYNGSTSQISEDLRSLLAQGLVQRRIAWIGGKQGKLPVLVLTKSGKQLLEQDQQSLSGQTVYAGFVKPSEVAHDAAIYRMYQAEAALIERRGGTIRRVVLDYELKQKVYSPLAKARHLPAAEYAKKQGEVAQENGLKVIKGKIPLPDLRIEFETRDGEMTRVDLELTTGHYHGRALQAKAEAGFKMYAADGSASRLSRVLEEREITADILSL